MQKWSIPGAESLRREFESASAQWPNLTSVLFYWPEERPEPELPSYLLPPDLNAKGESITRVWYDQPGRRYRQGCVSAITKWRRFGQRLVFVPGKEAQYEKLGRSGWRKQRGVDDPAQEMAAIARLTALARTANRLVDELGGAGLSVGCLKAFREADRWILSVHELIRPVEVQFAHPPAHFEKIDELWLESARAIDEIVERCGNRFALASKKSALKGIETNTRLAVEERLIERASDWRMTKPRFKPPPCPECGGKAGVVSKQKTTRYLKCKSDGCGHSWKKSDQN